MKRISILGSTGSIGRRALRVVSRLPELFEVVGLAARSNIDTIEGQIHQFHPKRVALADEDAAKLLKERLKVGQRSCPSFSESVEVLAGQEGVIEIARMAEADIVFSGIVGSAGLLPTLEAIKAHKNLALAHKEALVMGGELVMKAAAENNVKILPVDGEMSAIFQCIEGNKNREHIKKLILTASGGPFRQATLEELANVDPNDALRHPTWPMGPRITIDSATLMNKGFEVIETKWLFGVEISEIDVIIHPESIVHSMVEFVDGSIIAQLGVADMSTPIQYALTYPERAPTGLSPLSLTQVGSLNFEEVDMDKFPCLRLALNAAETGGTMTAVLQSADEVAVKAFLDGKIKFLDIPRIVEEAMSMHDVKLSPNLSDILATDDWAKETASELTIDYWEQRNYN